MAKQKVPRYAYCIVLISSFLVLTLLFAILLKSRFAGSHPLVFALGLYWILGVVFGFVWPGGSWRLGLWVSSGLWLFLGFVFVSFVFSSQVEWSPAIEAIAVAALPVWAPLLGSGFRSE